MALLGLTWIFGAIAIDGCKVTFLYLLYSFNTLQGFLVFIFFGISPSETRTQLQNVFQRVSKAIRQADQPQNNKEQNSALTQKDLTKGDGVSVQDEHLQKFIVDLKFPDKGNEQSSYTAQEKPGERDDDDHVHWILYKRTTRLNKKLEFKGSFCNLRHINKTITVPNILYIYCIKYSIMRIVCVCV